MTGPFRHPGQAPAPIVAFDFDGTLTCRDSFIAFLAWRAGWMGFMAGLVALTPATLAYAADRNRGALKAAVARRFLGGVTRSHMERDARRFAETRFAALIRPDALRCWRAWREKGARLIIVTASPELLVAPFAEALRADALIGTRLVFDAEDRVDGGLDGENCRGPQKVARLRAALGADVKLAAAYGDSAGDHEMLAMADIAGLKVFKERP